MNRSKCSSLLRAGEATGEMYRPEQPKLSRSDLTLKDPTQVMGRPSADLTGRAVSKPFSSDQPRRCLLPTARFYKHRFYFTVNAQCCASPCPV